MANLKLKGVETVSRQVTVSVSTKDVIEEVVVMIRKKHGLSCDSYLDDQGYINEFSYTHTHNGDDVYVRKDKANADEIKAFEMIDFLRKLL